MTLREGEIYLGAKKWLQNEDWQVFAGQPPNGSDDIPVIEIKLLSNTDKGSRGSYKPDLVATKEGSIMIVECKPNHSDSDAAKLIEILSSMERKRALFEELEQRKLIKKLPIAQQGFDLFHRQVKGMLAHSGRPKEQRELYTLVVKDKIGNAELFPPC